MVYAIEEWAYLAGLFDGEGSISSCTHGDKNLHPLLDVLIYNTSKDLMEYLLRRFGEFGKIYSWKERRSSFPGKKILFRFQISNFQKQEIFLKNIFPFLQVKREHVGLALRYLESRIPERGRGKRFPLTPEQKDLIYSLKKLNSKEET